MKLKMYIVIHETVPLGLAVVAAAHASLATYFKFKDDSVVRDWLADSFYKVIVRADAFAFEAAKQLPDSIVLTESSLGGREVAIGFKPREEWPDLLRKLPLYKGPVEGGG
jgi:hypothetical protein